MYKISLSKTLNDAFSFRMFAFCYREKLFPLVPNSEFDRGGGETLMLIQRHHNTQWCEFWPVYRVVPNVRTHNPEDF